MRAGDHVLHRPTGETWTLAGNPEHGKVQWFGWPEGYAKESDCELQYACTDEEHKQALEEWAIPHRRDDGSLDSRHLTAVRQLDELYRTINPTASQ